MQPFRLSLHEASRAIRTKALSPVELVTSCLERIIAMEPVIGAFACVTGDLALEQARAAQAEIAAGHYRGPLHGVPIAVKDLIDTAGVPTTCSSRVRAGRVPRTDAAVVTMLRGAGAVTIGKTHTHEFAFGATTPTTANPWDTTRVPGGSSGGTAAAIAYGGVHAGLGSDTGGSIRIPAAVCGTVGLKPTYGRVPRVGVASLSWSLDHVGPLSRNVRDAAVVMNAVAGYDHRDPGSVPAEPEDFTRALGRGVEGLRVGVPTNWYTDRLDPEVARAVSDGLAVLEGLGARLRQVEIPMTEQLVAMEWGIMMPEASAYHRAAMRRCPELYTDEVRALLEQGETVLATDYIDALRLRQRLKGAWAAMMTGLDVVVAPTTFAPALPRVDPHYVHADGSREDATPGYVRLSLPMNLTGLPSLQVPCGFSAAGLPIGMQIMGKPFREADLLGVGHAVEAATDWVGRIAPTQQRQAA